MKNALLSAVVLAGLASRGFAQEPKDDLFKDIKMGDRVELTLKSEFAIRGKLVQTSINDEGKVVMTADPNVDLSKMTKFILDVALEYPELAGGEMGVERVQIKAVRKLRQLTAEEAKAIEKLREAALEATRKQDDARRAASAKEDQGRLAELEAIERKKREAAIGKEAARLKEEAEMLEKAAAIYKRFPPPEWGPNKLAEISKKGQLKLPVTETEQEFQRNFELWLKYDQFMKQPKEEPKKEDK